VAFRAIIEILQNRHDDTVTVIVSTNARASNRIDVVSRVPRSGSGEMVANERDARERIADATNAV
jgi:hypothetical protein